MLFDAMRVWMSSLEAYPGWKEWRKKRFGHTLHFDDLSPNLDEEPGAEFVFSSGVEKEHAIVTQYFQLEETAYSLKECEYYFRRYPFRGLPVTRHNHLTNICEMYFGRFYEFRERLKNYLNAVDAALPDRKVNIGAFIKLFDRAFEQELRARNRIHHHERFEDIALDRVFLTEALALNHKNKSWQAEHLAAYRKVSSEWAQRVRKRGAKLDEFLEAIATATAENCLFLRNPPIGPANEMR